LSQFKWLFLHEGHISWSKNGPIFDAKLISKILR